MQIKHHYPLLGSSENVSRVAALYNDCHYVFDTAPMDVNKNFIDQPMSVFFTKEKHPEGSNFMGIYHVPRLGHFITDALPRIKGKTFAAVQANNGDLIYSAYRHDFHWSDDGSVFIDGGRDYTHTSCQDIVLFSIDESSGTILEAHP